MVIKTIPLAVDLLSLEPQVPWMPARPVTGVATITAAAYPSTAPTRLIGANQFSEQYVVRCMGPGYLVRPGKGGLLTPEQRASFVNWLSTVHAAVSAASSNGLPLYHCLSS